MSDIVYEAKQALAAEGKRGSKVVERAARIEDAECVTPLSLINMRGREIKRVEVREPAEVTTAWNVIERDANWLRVWFVAVF